MIRDKAEISRPLSAKSFGVGLKPEHAEAILQHRQPVDFFEIHAENYMNRGGANRRFLARIAQDYPISLHGVGLSLGSLEPLDRHKLKQLVEVAQFCAPALISEHLAWCDFGDRIFPDLLPLPYDDAALAAISEKIDQTQQALGQKILIENPASYFGFAGDFFAETEFLAALAQKTGCGLLLDVNNVHVAATNRGFDAVDYIDRFPLDLVGEIHLAGFSRAEDAQGEFLIDSHGAPVDPQVWALYAQALALGGPRPSLVEWDNALPDWPDLLAELLTAKTIAESAAPEIGQTRAQRAALPTRAISTAPNHWRQDFAAALRDPSAQAPDFVVAADPQKRFAVHRNNWTVAAREALKTNFPTLVQMLGDEAFGRVATEFAQNCPPSSPILGDYGADFAGFLQEFLAAQNREDLAYLPDLARLDHALLGAARAPDAAPASLAQLSAIDPEKIGEVRATPHPSTRLIRSAFPLLALREAENAADIVWGDENLLILRPDDTLWVKKLSAAESDFFAACIERVPLSDAAQNAQAADKNFDFGAVLVELTRAGAFVSFPF